jgi:hypothetical protein
MLKRENHIIQEHWYALKKIFCTLCKIAVNSKTYSFAEMRTVPEVSVVAIVFTG